MFNVRPSDFSVYLRQDILLGALKIAYTYWISALSFQLFMRLFYNIHQAYIQQKLIPWGKSNPEHFSFKLSWPVRLLCCRWLLQEQTSGQKIVKYFLTDSEMPHVSQTQINQWHSFSGYIFFKFHWTCLQRALSVIGKYFFCLVVFLTSDHQTLQSI